MNPAGKIPKSREVDALEWREFLSRPLGSGRESDNNEPCAGGADQDRQRRLGDVREQRRCHTGYRELRDGSLSERPPLSPPARTAIGARAALETRFPKLEHGGRRKNIGCDSRGRTRRSLLDRRRRHSGRQLGATSAGPALRILFALAPAFSRAHRRIETVRAFGWGSGSQGRVTPWSI